MRLVALVILALAAGCVAPADVALVAREPLACDADPDAPRSRLPSHPALLDPDAPARLRAAMGDGTARASAVHENAALLWSTTRDLTGLSPADADALVRRALEEVGVDDVRFASWEAWRAGAGAAVEADQEWRGLRTDGVRFHASDGTRFNESTLRIGPLLDFGPAEHPGVSEARAERIAQRFLDCARDAAGAPRAEVASEGLALDAGTLAWAFAGGNAGPGCGWPDRALVDAFTGGVVWAGPSCMT